VSPIIATGASALNLARLLTSSRRLLCSEEHRPETGGDEVQVEATELRQESATTASAQTLPAGSENRAQPP
jgi:hypothetical protein